jgi:hypothetical protein
LLAFCDWIVDHLKKKLVTEIFVIALLAACVLSNEKAKAWEGIKLFHELFNKGEFFRIYDSASEQARAEISRESSCKI